MKRLDVAWMLLLALCLLSASPTSAAPARGEGRILRKGILVLPFRSTVHRTPDERYLGLGLAHVLDHVVTLHSGLDDTWGPLYTRRLFPSRQALDSYVQGRGTDQPAMGAVDLRWVVEGTVIAEGAHLAARLTVRDHATGHGVCGSLPLDLPGLQACRGEFTALLARARIPLPAGQLARAAWKEELPRAALALAGRGLLDCYWGSADDGARWDPAPFRAALRSAPGSYVLQDALGFALLRERTLAEAQCAFEQALLLNPFGRHAASGVMECMVARRERAPAEQWGSRQAEMGGRDGRRGRARAASALGDELLSGSADPGAALVLFQAALVRARQAGDRQEEGAALRGAGMACENLDRHEDAVTCLRQASSLARGSGDLEGEATALGALGISLGRAQKWGEAVTTLELAVRKVRPLGDRSSEGTLLAHLGGAYDSLSRFEQAAACCRQGAALLREVGDRSGEAVALGNLGLVLDHLGRSKEALEAYQRALSLSREARERGQESVILVNMAGCLDRIGQYDQALAHLEQARAIAVEGKDPEREGGVHNTMGLVQTHRSRYGNAMACFERALALERQVGDREGEAATQANIGTVHNLMGQYERALDHYEWARVILRGMNERAGEATVMNNMAVALQGLCRHEQAVAILEQAAAIQREVKDPSGLAYTLVNLGKSRLHQGRREEALALCRQALALFRALGERAGESSTLALQGRALLRGGQHDRAETCFSRSLALAREMGDRTHEASALGGLTDAARQAARPTLAIFFGKLCVNAWQEVRAQMRSLARDSRDSFVHEKEHDYRVLADLLIGQGRLDEAERVIGMLKDEEYARDVRGGTSGAATASAPLTPREEDWRTRYDALVDRLGTLAAAHDALEGQRSRRALTGEEKRRLLALDTDLDAAQEAYRRFLEEVSTQALRAGDASDRLRAVRQDEDLKALLADLGDHAVILYTLVTADNYHVILVTPSFQEVFTSPVTRETLNGMVSVLRQELVRPSSDPRETSRALYDVMLGRAVDRTGRITLAERLRQYGAETLMWELDGALRYCPVAALYDGRGYLVERYACAVFTPASKINLREVPDPRAWSALGMGVSLPLDGFPALASVEGELRAIIRGDVAGSGVLPGRVLMNATFTREAMREALLDSYRVVHIASHFAFEPGEGGRSFLLLGQGHPPRLSLADLVGWGGSPFRGVDLLTLSACNTAMGGGSGAGREVENLAVAAQDKGARAVLATLWAVDDPSTSAFMEAFYRTMRAGGISKAAAVRAAQLALLKGGQARPPNGERRAGRLSTAGTDGDSGLPEAEGRRAAWSHPYFWAPFILIGNWK